MPSGGFSPANQVSGKEADSQQQDCRRSHGKVTGATCFYRDIRLRVGDGAVGAASGVVLWVGGGVFVGVSVGFGTDLAVAAVSGVGVAVGSGPTTT